MTLGAQSDPGDNHEEAVPARGRGKRGRDLLHSRAGDGVYGHHWTGPGDSRSGREQSCRSRRNRYPRQRGLDGRRRELVGYRRDGGHGRWHRRHGRRRSGRRGNDLPEPSGIRCRARTPASSDAKPVSERRSGRVRVRRLHQRSRRRQLHRELREHRCRHRGHVRSRGRAVQHGHRERRQRGIRRCHEARAVHRVHADRPEQRHLRARLHSEARASRLAPAARERGARSIRRPRRQRVDDPGQRDRGGALGDGGAVHVAELPLSPGARGVFGRGASAQRLRDRVSPLVPDLEQPSRTRR